MLSTIAGSMITVAGVTFSITIVALTLASQQFGPRLLRSFLRDLGNQIVLGTFVSTFVYCLLVLRTVRGTDDTQFVPHLAVTLGVVLAMLSLGVLIFFIHHVSTSIQASQIIARVAADLEASVTRLFPDRLGEGRREPPPATTQSPADFEDRGRAVLSSTSGYVQAIDGERLLSVASEFELVLRVEAGPGQFVRTGTPLARVRSESDDAQVSDRIRAAFIIGSARTPTQDPLFFVEQLVEMAVRALSPGINDPGTALLCIDRLGAALCQMAGRETPSRYRIDDDGALRVIAAPLTFSRFADTCFVEIRRYGRSSPSVTLRLLDVIAETAACVHREEDRLALLRHANTIAEEARDAGNGWTDASTIVERQRRTVRILTDSSLDAIPSESHD